MFSIFLFASAALFAGLGLYSYTQTQPVFSSPVNLSNDLGNAHNPSVTNVGNYVYVSWSEGSRGILFRASPDGGYTWSPSISSPALRISPKGGVAEYPLMSANDSNIYVTWSQSVGLTGLQIFEATSLDNGSSFTSRQLTSGIEISSNGSVTPAIASWGSNVIIGYAANGSSYVLTSTNAGSTWSTPYKISHAHEPQVAISGSYMYAIADGNNVAVSKNNGSTWRLVHPSYLMGCCSHEPFLAAHGNNVYAVWEGKGNLSFVSVSSSNDNGRTWNTQNLSSYQPDSWAPMIGAYGNSAWVAWQQRPGGPSAQVWETTSTNGGLNWSKPISISGRGHWVGWPFEVASTDAQNVYTMWGEQVNSSSNYWVIRVSYSGDGGQTWSPAPGIEVSNNSNGQASPENDLANGAISSYGASAFAVWQYTSTSNTNQTYFITSSPSMVTTTSTSSSSTSHSSSLSSSLYSSSLASSSTSVASSISTASSSDSSHSSISTTRQTSTLTFPPISTSTSNTEITTSSPVLSTSESGSAIFSSSISATMLTALIIVGVAVVGSLIAASIFVRRTR